MIAVKKTENEAQKRRKERKHRITRKRSNSFVALHLFEDKTGVKVKSFQLAVSLLAVVLYPSAITPLFLSGERTTKLIICLAIHPLCSLILVTFLRFKNSKVSERSERASKLDTVAGSARRLFLCERVVPLSAGQVKSQKMQKNGDSLNRLRFGHGG